MRIQPAGGEQDAAGEHFRYCVNPHGVVREGTNGGGGGRESHERIWACDMPGPNCSIDVLPPFFLHFSSAGMRRLEEHENMQRDCPDQQGKQRLPARHLASRLPAHGSALSQAARTVAKRRLPTPVNPPGRSAPHFGRKTPRQIMAQRPFAGWPSKVTSLLSQHERCRAYPHEIF